MSIGNLLRQARERAGLSPEEIAERTKIEIHRIEALENDDLERLPLGVYLDGIVRAYAHEVGIDPGPLIERVRPKRELVDLDKFSGEWLAKFPAEAGVGNPPTSVARTEPVVTPGLLEPRGLLGSERPVPRSPRIALLLVLLLAAAGWGAYFYQVLRPVDRDRALDIAAAPNQAGTDAAAASSVERLPESNVSAAAPREETASNATTTIPAERSIPSAVPKAAPGGRPAMSSGTEAPPAPTSSDANTLVKDVSGSWTLTTHVERGSYKPFENLNLGYEIELQQTGNRVTGSGRKVVESGDEIGSSAQTPISLAGTINGDRLTLTVSEHGTQRTTEGRFVLLLDEGGQMRGRFSSTAAQSSGTVEARRRP
jgi:cytoskeletal protein RodZ